MNKNIFTPILFFIIANIFLMAVLWSLPYEDKTIDVKCYDRYSNEILGLECKTEITGVDFNTKLLISAFVETMLVVVLVIQIKAQY